MTTKQVMTMIVGLHQCRMKDLEIMDSFFRDLNGRINTQSRLLGISVELQKDRFSGNDEDLGEILSIISADAAMMKDLERDLNRFQIQRDQSEAAIETMKAILAEMSDE